MHTQVLTYILEDDQATSEVIGELLKAHPLVDYRIFNQSADLIEQLTPDVQICVLDYLLGERLTGLDVMKLVLQVSPDCFVIFISGQTNMNVVIDFFHNGGKKYVNKNNPAFLNDVVDTVLYAVKEIKDKKKMLLEIQHQLHKSQTRSDERRGSKTHY